MTKTPLAADATVIRAAVDAGKKVRADDYMDVVKDSKGQYLLKGPGGYCIGLTWADNTTLNAKKFEVIG